MNSSSFTHQQLDLDEYAGFGHRFVAAMIDTVALGVIGVVFHYIFFGDSGLGFAFEGNVGDIGFYRSLMEQLLFISLTVFMWVKFLGTPGKLLLDCYVVDAITRRPVGVGQAILRYIGYFISIIPLGLGFFWIIWDKRKQGFHDKIAGTVVVVESRHAEADDESQKTLKQLVGELR